MEKKVQQFVATVQTPTSKTTKPKQTLEQRVRAIIADKADNIATRMCALPGTPVYLNVICHPVGDDFEIIEKGYSISEEPAPAGRIGDTGLVQGAIRIDDNKRYLDIVAKHVTSSVYGCFGSMDRSLGGPKTKQTRYVF